jgi:hypothetical protein
MWTANGQVHAKYKTRHSKQIFTLASYWFVLTLLVSYWSAFMYINIPDEYG